MDISKRTYESAGAVEAFDKPGYRKNEEEVISKYFSGSILDLGCGTGRSTKLIHDKGFRVLGADYSVAMIERAKKIFPQLSFVVADATALSFEPETFDTVFFSTNGIDYPYPKGERIKALREIHRVLKQGGTFVFTSHNNRFPRNAYRMYHFARSALLGKVHPYRYEFTHYGRLLTYHISPPAQKKQLEQNGFKLLEVMSPESSYPTYVARRE
jgi:ubiquinone/menaquinone biosynthesis C-methylase UbiE